MRTRPWMQMMAAAAAATSTPFAVLPSTDPNERPATDADPAIDEAHELLAQRGVREGFAQLFGDRLIDKGGGAWELKADDERPRRKAGAASPPWRNRPASEQRRRRR